MNICQSSDDKKAITLFENIEKNVKKRGFYMENTKDTVCRGMDLRRSVVMGSGKFGGVVPDRDCWSFLDLYYELGGRVIDTGHCYGMFFPGGGRQPLAEWAIGKYLHARRDKNFLLCTKGGYPDLDSGAPRLNRRDLDEDLEASLRELQTDHIDIYYLHRDDPSLPVEEIVPLWDTFVRAGKVLAVGVSNWSPARVRAANAFAEAHGLEPISFVQNLYSRGSYCAWPMDDPTMRVTGDADLKAFAQMPNVQFVAYSAQAYGFFSKVDARDPLAAERLIAQRYPYFDVSSSLERARRVQQLADEHRVTPAVVVLSFVLSDPLAPAAIIGCTKPWQIREAMEARALRLNDMELAYLRAPRPARPLNAQPAPGER